MTGTTSLCANVAAELRCDMAELESRLASVNGFAGSEPLPPEIAECWDRLTLDAKAIAVLFATNLEEESNQRWERGDRT